MHHISIRTAHIQRAIAFYEQLGFQVQERFTTGFTLACWLEGEAGRIELIQIPQPAPPPDAFGDEHYVGYYHLALDLTEVSPSLADWLISLQRQWQNQPELAPLKILLPPQQQQIGDSIYEVLFIADADGLPIECLRRLS
jgi:catechol 2,3-dioxygenase-like lactoylglutathione lyase family enzyme